MSPNEAKSIIEALANGVDPETEDRELLSAFDAGGSIKDISAKHGRTEGAIASRLIRLGRFKK